MSIATISLFMEGGQEKSNNSKNEQSETTELTEAIRTLQTFDKHHYGTTEARKTRPYSQINQGLDKVTWTTGRN
jgi:hypothetical protein